MNMNDPVYQNKLAFLMGLMGSIVARWASIESATLLIFAGAINISPIRAASAMSHVNSFKVILNVTDSIVRSGIKDQGEREFWDSLVKYVRELAEDRNQIVHRTIRAYIPPELDQSNSSLAEPGLHPDLGKMLISAKGLPPYDIQELTELCEDISEASNLLNQYWAWRFHKTPSPPIFSAPIRRRRLPREQRLAPRKKTPTPPRSPSH